PEALLGLGAAGVLRQPFDLAELSRAVGLALGCSQPERQPAVCLSIRSAAEFPQVIDPVAEAMARLGYPRKDTFGVRLALEEALANAVKHGNRGDPRRQVRVRYRVTAEEGWAEGEDEGSGFDPAGGGDPLSPEGVQRPSGRGLLLMRHFLSSVCYNERGNAVTLRKWRGQAAAGVGHGGPPPPGGEAVASHGE